MRSNVAAISLVFLFVSGCPKGSEKAPVDPPGRKDAGGSANPFLPIAEDAAIAQLPPAPPLPELPAGLPPVPAMTATPELVALGELLFHDARLSISGKVACATCHVPSEGYAGASRQETAAGKPNLRRAPSLVNLAWTKELGWDGRSPTMEALLGPHVRGQMGDDVPTAIARVAELPGYRAHFARTMTASTDAVATARLALEAFVATRYSGGAPWDTLEKDPALPAKLKAGYQLFAGKAQCATCHPPPLYTDHAYRRLGLIATGDEGRARAGDKTKLGAFRTPGLRGAAKRKAFFHDASATTLAAAIDWHLAGGVGQGADPSIIDPALVKVTLTVEERANLGVFVDALTETAPAPAAPALP
ncbi:MAG: cytochrome-c peroxidase [Kofleriaceae bacterium]